MCGRYGFTSSDIELSERFDAERIAWELKESYNIAPTQEAPIIERHSPNTINKRRWGFKPGWSKMALINAQAEKLAESKVWSKAFRESRCIVPANWFYEWKRLDDGKQPYVFKVKEEKIFGIAGLIMNYHDDKGKEETGFIIITTTPNSLMEKIHNRMPAILRKADEDTWLNPDASEPEKLLACLEPYPSAAMEAYPISSLVNSPKNNFPELLKPVTL